MLQRRLQEIEGYIDLGMWEEANNVIEALPAESKTLPAVLALRVRVYLAAGSWELMAEVSRHLTTVEAGNAIHWLNYAQSTLYVKGLPPSLDILEKAVERFPANAEILYSLACRESEMGRIEEARAHLGAAIKIDPRLRQNALDDPELNALWDEFNA